MDLKQLNALVAVADTGSFSAAARSLHTVQSNVSTHVAHLEREVGSTLVDRATGRLTEEGEVVAARARIVASELDALVADVAALHDQVVGNVRLGVIGTTARWLVPPLVMAMDERFARIRLVVVDATTSSLLPQVVAGSLDLAVVNVPIEDPDLISEALFVEDPILVAPSSHPLAAKDRVTLADIAQHRLLLEPQGTGFRDLIDEGARAVGLSFEPQAEIDGMRLLASLAFQGFGAAILPASAAPGWIGGDWKRVPIDGLVSRTVGLTWRRRGLLSAPARAVREVLRDVVMAAAPAEFGIHPTAERAAALTAEATPRRPDGPTGNRRGPGGV